MQKFQNKTVGELMTKKIISVKPFSLMSEVANCFNANNFHHLPVINDDGVCVGIISKLDYYQLQDSFTKLDGSRVDDKNSRFLSSLLAQEVMTANPISVESNVDISDVIAIFIANSAHSAIVTENNICVGIITPLDLLQHLQQLLTQKTTQREHALS